MFRALRIAPLLGRIFGAEDEDPDGALTIMLSEGYWRSRFGSDPEVVGRTLQIDGATREIIGVMPGGEAPSGDEVATTYERIARRLAEVPGSLSAVAG